ncbi:hypothetical protein [Candidatus Poriferisodalis sp.]|uniref:hypothetical protein n=1 Tax=Candidatus Poriferisodalis sp. TaxID=3101277 RepID=UPI003C703626
MAKRRRRRTAGRRLFVDGQPERMRDLRMVYAEPAADERRDGPVGGSGNSWSSSDDSRKATGPRLTLNSKQRVFAVLCSKPFWAEAEFIQQAVDEFDRSRTGRRRGRPRDNSAADMLAYRQMELVCEGMNAADREIGPDPHAGLVRSLWDEAQEALEQAWPDRPERRLSAKPVNRTKYHNFCKRFLTDDMLEHIALAISDHAVEGALDTGLLDPADGTHTNPHTTQLIYGDGCWFSTPHNHGAKIRRDPDATEFFNNDGTRADAPGNLAVRTYIRGEDPNTRITLTVDVKDPQAGPMSDARIAVDRILGLLDRHSALREGAKGFVYDMALRSAEHDDLLDAGIIGISHTPKTANGRPAARNLGTHKFRIGTETIATMTVTAIDGAPTIHLVDGNGDDLAVPLLGGQVRRRWRKRLGRYAVYRDWHIPRQDHVPPQLQGATTEIRHNSSDTEREAKPHQRLASALRVFPDYDPVMLNKYGLREDSESSNNHTKDMFPHRRANTLGRRRLHFKLFAAQHHDLVTALLNHAKRTSNDVSDWFGRYLAHLQPADDQPTKHARDGPLPLAA